MMQKTCKMIETLANWYSFESTQGELSNEYQQGRFSKILASFCFGQK